MSINMELMRKKLAALRGEGTKDATSVWFNRFVLTAQAPCRAAAPNADSSRNAYNPCVRTGDAASPLCIIMICSSDV